MRINHHKYSQSQTGETVAPQAYNRPNPPAIHRPTQCTPHPPHLEKPNEKPRKLTLTQALKITLLYHRHNLTEELLAEFFNISQPTVSRTINLMEKALDAPGSLVIDGTLVPTWNWRSRGKANFSGKHKRAGFNHQVICTIDGKLLAITNPLPGVRHDAFAFKEHGLKKYPDSTTLADKEVCRFGVTDADQAQTWDENASAYQRQQACH